jgi:hypothetical protein
VEISARAPLKVDEILSNSRDSNTRVKSSGHSRATLRGGNLVANLGDVNAHISAYRSGNPVENPFATATQVLKTPFLLAQIKSAFDAIPSDDRKLWIKLGHAAKTLDDDGGDEAKRAWLEWSKKSEKFDLDDAEASWESFKPTITSHEKIFLVAEDYGWDVQAANANINAILRETKSPREFEYPDRDFGDLKASTAFNQGQAKFKNDLNGDFDLVTYNRQLLEDVKSIPKRDWIIPRLLLGGNISLILGPGGVAKSMLQLIAAVSVATGRDLLRLGSIRRCNALVINNEDDKNELQRRVSAVVSQFSIDPAELEGSLYTISGYLRPVRFAHHIDNRVLRGSDLDKIEAFIAEQKIEALFVDPFISTHTAPENDNNAMDQVVSIFKRLSGKSRIAINIAHHTKKIGGDTEVHAGDAESGRGASSIKDAARAAVTIARMGKKTAEKLDIADEVRGDYIRMDVGKMNFAPHDSKANWFRIEQVILANRDSVGVPVPVNLDAQFAQAQDGRKKWTPETMAMAVANLFPGAEDQVPWANVKGRYMNEHGVGTSVAGNNITLLPQEGDAAIRVRGYEIWITRTALRNGWMLHRKEVSDA